MSDPLVSLLVDAIALLHRLRQDSPDTARRLATALWERGRAACAVGDRPEAEHSLCEALRFNPDFPEAARALAFVLERRGSEALKVGQTAEAQAALHQALALLPGNVGLWRSLCDCFYVGGDTVAAVAAGRRALQLDPTHRQTVVNLGLMLYEINRYQEVEEILLPRIDDLAAGPHPAGVLENLGSILIGTGRLREAFALFSRLLAKTDRSDVCATLAAEAALESGNPGAALDILCQFKATNRSSTFTLLSRAQFQRSLTAMGESIPRRTHDPAAGPFISSSSLSSYGRFAHQVGEYLPLRFYAEEKGLVLETPEWVGHYFFELDDPRMPRLPRLPLRRYLGRQIRRTLDGADEPILANLDIWSPSGPGLPRKYRERTRALLRPRRLWEPFVAPAVEALRRRGGTLIALHIRRGDRVEMGDITPTALYRAWLDAVWSSFDNPVLYIASDDVPAVKADFAAYAPLSLDDLAEPWSGNEYLQDFCVLMNADVLGVTTGCFATLAAELSVRGRLFVRPTPEDTAIVPFDPWPETRL